MGLFGKIFEKKSCDICGGEIGLLGNRKLEDGNLCKECAKKLSPFFSERRRSTVEQIREQLDYREANKDRVAGFNTTRTLGGDTKVLLDEDAQCFIVTSSSRWRDANPDVMDFSQVTGCDSEVRETRTEIYRENSEGHRESYDPPRYDIDYDVYLTIHVNSRLTSTRSRSRSTIAASRNVIRWNSARRSARPTRYARRSRACARRCARTLRRQRLRR